MISFNVTIMTKTTIMPQITGFHLITEKVHELYLTKLTIIASKLRMIKNKKAYSQSS